MPIINFTKFIEKVESGEKRQTIRAVRKRPIKVGDKLYLYSGLRTKEARNLLSLLGSPDCLVVYQENAKPYTICKEVHDIKMIQASLTNKYCIHILIDNTELTRLQQTELANKDGFNQYIHRDTNQDVRDFIEFFIKTHGLPFKGQLIKW